jgi:hypothetical protein
MSNARTLAGQLRRPLCDGPAVVVGKAMMIGTLIGRRQSVVRTQQRSRRDGIVSEAQVNRPIGAWL